MEVLILRTEGNAGYMAFYANPGKERRPKVPSGPNYLIGGIVSGEGPWLYGRRVTQLKITTDGEDEILRWREPPDVIGDDVHPARIEFSSEVHMKEYRRSKLVPLDDLYRPMRKTPI